MIDLYTIASTAAEESMSTPETAIVTVRVDAVLKTKLEALARSTRRSKSYLAAEAIAAYVALNEWQIAEIEAGIAELEAGEIVSGVEAERRYERLLKRR
jgi:predicted transcriptional regulator